jgi:tRNA pseudouridine55 synthase
VLETAPDGIVLVDKPQGISSHRVVSIARRRFGTRKIGHAGTLDPMATGLLVLGVGPSTRLLTHLVGLDKTYSATIRLGIATDSDDADGTPTASVGVGPSGIDDAALDAAVDAQRGPISQVPSTVSAIKVDGRRAYDLARKGEAVELKPRNVVVHRFDVTGRHSSTVTIDGADVQVLDVDVTVRCSSGTYIRALARDIGTALGTGGHLTALRRLDVGPFDVSEAVDIEDEAVDVLSALQTPAAVAGRLFPVLELDEADAKDLSDGKRVRVEHDDADGPVAAVSAASSAAVSSGRLIGLVSVRNGTLRVITNFPVPPQGAPA